MTDAELIECISVEVMGWKQIITSTMNEFDSLHDCWDTGTKMIPRCLWNPLTDANHWMMVVNKLWENDHDFELISDWNKKRDWSARFSNGNGPVSHQSIGHAVCLAALEAVRGK